MTYSVIEIKKVLGEYKIEAPKNIWIDEFIALRSKTHSFKYNDKNTEKLKVISEAQSKHVKYENKNCLDGEK